MIIELVGEFIVEILAYGTFTLMKAFLQLLPIRWNTRVVNIMSAMLGILIWVILVIVVVKILEKIL